MARGSPVLVSPSQPAEPLGTPITALQPFSLRRTSSAQGSVASSGRGSRVGDDGAASISSPLGGALALAAATPSFANRGFVSRFSPQAVAASSEERPPGSAAARSGGRLGSRLRQASPLLWEQHGRRLSAPSGYTETAASEGVSPSFSIQAPSGLTDSEDESDEEGGRGAGGSGAVESRRRSSLGAGVRPLSPAEVALTELTTRLEKQLRVQGQLRVARLERVLLELDVREQQAAQQAKQEQQRQQAEAARADEAQQVQQAQQRQQILSALRAEHERKARQAQQQLARKEEAAKAEAQRREREAQQAQQAKQVAEEAKRAQQAAAQQAQQEAARKAQEGAAAAAAAEAKQKAAEAAAAQQQQAAAAAAEAAAKDPFPARASPSALQWQQQCAERLKAAQESVRPFVEDRAMRDKKRSIDKFVTLNVQQISATLDQVRAKGMALVHFMGQQQGAQRTYALLTLANKLLSQCEAQVTRLHSFAFPLAEVAVAVAAAHPDFVELLMGRLHQVCVLSVPVYYSFRSGKGDEDEYLKRMGYKFATDEDTGKVTKESTDEYVGRMQGYLLLLAAVTQSANPANPYGLAQAWAYLARLLNALPANRITATALDAVLKVTGYRLQAAYRGQFMKLLQYIDREFLGDLSKQNDPDARAVYTRVQTYLKTGRFLRPPEGREMPQSDASSYDRA